MRLFISILVPLLLVTTFMTHEVRAAKGKGPGPAPGPGEEWPPALYPLPRDFDLKEFSTPQGNYIRKLYRTRVKEVVCLDDLLFHRADAIFLPFLVVLSSLKKCFSSVRPTILSEPV